MDAVYVWVKIKNIGQQSGNRYQKVKNKQL
jgi:hypothetical protein